MLNALNLEEDPKKPVRNKFLKHANVLIWKCYLQRQRRWRTLVLETGFAFVLYVIAVLIAKPVFLTPLQTRPQPPLSVDDILASLQERALVGYAPKEEPYRSLMASVAEILQIDMLSGADEDELNDILYDRSKGTPLNNSIIWIIWKPKDGNVWKFSIRSTERARTPTDGETVAPHNPHLRAGFLAVQVAVSQAIIEYSSASKPDFELSLVSMPVSPLMQEREVRRAISLILLCLTLALIPPVLETQALVVEETQSRFKRALRIRGVDFSTAYIAWLVFAYLTALPACLLASITLILVFRWIHLMTALVILLAYVSVMIMLALIQAMFHRKALIACLWSTLFTLLQMFLAQLLVYHRYDVQHYALTFLLNVALPPLGLVNALNQFALLHTDRDSHAKPSLFYTFLSWAMLNLLYFGILMLLQRTLRDRAIGGPVSWTSIVFKKAQDKNKLHHILTPSPHNWEKLQAVDDLVAKAISFRDVSKSIMNVPILRDITLDIYRGELTMLFSERIQENMLNTIEDLLTGLTQPDEGTIHVLGETYSPETNWLTTPLMMGYCHRMNFLIEDLTVEEHLTMFTEICLWNESKHYVSEYTQIRIQRLRTECDLEPVLGEFVRNLDVYYRAQLCWAIAMLLEPKIIFIPAFTDQPRVTRTITDKIMKYRKYMTIVLLCHASLQLEYADRVFIFENKVLAFGGTPAYMFFKYGREYKVRVTFRDGQYFGTGDTELIARATEIGASVRAHLGSLLILRLPATPTATVAAFVKELDDNFDKYGIASMSVCVADTEEVCQRAIHDIRATTFETLMSQEQSKEALKKIAESRLWKRMDNCCISAAQMTTNIWKFVSFFLYYKIIFLIMLLIALVTGVCIGLSLSTVLIQLDQNSDTKKLLHGEILTVESMRQKTTLVIRLDDSNEAISIASGYVMSHTKAKKEEVKDIDYTALSSKESLTEYLVTRAIDAPQNYVYLYAYGMDVTTDGKGRITVKALYSPIHHDQGAAARSLGRVYTALLRHYTGRLDAAIEVTDDPLELDLTPWMKLVVTPPLFVKFLLTLTITHITLIPSKEAGLVRHVQSKAMNFSPTRYWLSLYFCDLILYTVQAGLMTLVMVGTIHLLVPLTHFSYLDLVVVPIMLLVYGVACIPQAYLFSLGRQAALNSMTFFIVNVVFGETTVIAMLFYGEALSYALYFIRISPQFNMAYAYVKVKQIFLYNSECVLFRSKKLCSANSLHKCCPKCGILQECFKVKSAFDMKSGIVMELFAMASMALVLLIILLVWEYRIIHRIFRYVKSLRSKLGEPQHSLLAAGVKREMADVIDKEAEIKSKRREKVDTFGEFLLSVNISKKKEGYFIFRNIYLGVGKGEVLAVSGLKRHGRLALVETLAGLGTPSSGDAWCMSKWSLRPHPYQYCRHVSICCDKSPLPQWMIVYEALAMVAVLRGVPPHYVAEELRNYLEALELKEQAKMRVGHLLPKDRTRVYFAAAVVGAPPVIVLDECTAYQKYSVRRAMYFILLHLKKRGRAILISSSSVESHMPITNWLAILLDGHVYDIDSIDELIARYSNTGYTVVVHLKDELDVTLMFSRHFKSFAINDTSEVLVNVQVHDDDLSWSAIFEKMEALKAENPQVYSYIVTAIPINYIYNSILTEEHGLKRTDIFTSLCLNRISSRPLQVPPREVINNLMPFEKKYDITLLNELPWSVIFQR